MSNGNSSYTLDMRPVALSGIETFVFGNPGSGNSAETIFNAAQFGPGLALDGRIEFADVAGATMTLAVRMAGQSALDLSGLTLLGATSDDGVRIDGGRTGEAITGVSSAANTIDARGGQDRLVGGAAADALFGGNGADILIGRGGADLVVGGAGTDRMSGGGGGDTFLFDTARDAGVGNALRDVITDFNPTADLLHFDDGLQRFAGSGPFTGTAMEGRTALAANGQGLRFLLDVDGDGSADLEVLLKGLTTIGQNGLVFDL